MADNLFAEAGQNFRAAGETAIRSQEAETQKKNVQQQPGLEADRQIGETLRKAMGDKAEIDKVKTQAGLDIQTELIKKKMNMVTFPPSLAIFYAKKFKRPELMQMANQEMPLELSHAIVDSMGKRQMENMKPTIAGNMLTWMDADGNPQTMNLEEHGFHYRPAGKGGAGTDDFRADKEFIAEYERRRKDFSDPIKTKEMRSVDPDKYAEDQQWMQDNMDAYDGAVKRMAERGKGGAKKPGSPAAAAPATPAASAPFDADSFIQDALK